MKRAREPLREILSITKDHWDHPGQRDAVRQNFRKVQACRTEALGGEVYASPTGEKVFFHTCKSKCCPSCGNRGTQLWRREQWATLPDIPFVGVVLTMPDVFWPIFGAHRDLEHDLPALGAAAIAQWAWNRHRVRLHIIVIQHTFGGRLNHNPHLHIMVSAGGLKTADASWIESLTFDRNEMMTVWRFAVCWYLRRAQLYRLVDGPSIPSQFAEVIFEQEQRDWNIHITKQMSKKHFLGYAGRYIRRLPISQKRILEVTKHKIIYESKDTRAKALMQAQCTPEEFVDMLSQHVLERYQHSMRYFGLLAPRSRSQTSPAVFALLGQHPRSKPPRQRWADSIKKYFGVDPLLDAAGNRIRWVRRRLPVPPTLK